MIPFDASGAFRPVAEAVSCDASRCGRRRLRFFQDRNSLDPGHLRGGLARLLIPADFGVVAMVTTFSLLLMSFGLNGSTEAIIQCDEIDHFTASNLFWINVGAGLLFTIALPKQGRSWHGFIETRVCARRCRHIPYDLIGQHLLRAPRSPKRAMRFAAVSANDVSARALSVAVSILLARAGWATGH